MRKIIYSLSLAVLVLSTFACKKGENDPFMSLHSRKARVAGEWKVSKMEESKTNTISGITTSTTTSYNGTTETKTVTTGTNVQTSSDIYTIEYTFEKDGSFTMVTTNTSSSPAYIETSTGTWAFLGKSKSADLKNKEAITLSHEKMTNNLGETITLDGTFDSHEIFMIDQLKNKEIVFIYDESSSYGTNSNSKKGTSTLTKK